MSDLTDTTAYPVFADTTMKQDMLRELTACLASYGRLASFIARFNNTDITGATDGATIYATKNGYAEAVS